jgi:uncharacterized protein YuzE
MIKISYDNQGDILEIKFSDESIKDSEYIEESGLVVDYNEKGNIVGLEIISFSKKVSQGSDVRSLAI